MRAVWMLLILPTGLCAQTPSLANAAGAPTAKIASGTVTGTVYGEETRGVLRLASVNLVRVTHAANDQFPMNSNVFAQTDAEGHFSVSGVPVGEYYVTAAAGGYVATTQEMMTAYEGGVSAANVLGTLARIRVTADSTSSTSVSLANGATIGGRLLWADGNPIVGYRVNAARQNVAKIPPEFVGFPIITVGFSSTTDDRGRFRVSSLAAGSYTLMANVMMRLGADRMTFGANVLSVYAPHAIHAADAKLVAVRAGDVVDDVDITVDVSTMHRVSGHVDLPSPGFSFGGACIELQESGANDPAVRLQSREGVVDAQGNFTVSYVPAGTYTAVVVVQWDKPRAKGKDDESSASDGPEAYQASPSAIRVLDTDVSGVKLTLTPVSKD